MIVHNPESGYAREMRKWEARDGVLGLAERPYVRRDYPLMMHKVGVGPKGGIEIIAQEIVQVEGERVRLERQGFRATPLEAIEALEAEQLNHAELAAEREHEKRHGMSLKARAEVERHEEAAGANHLPMVPETPIGPRRIPVLTDRDVKDALLANESETIEMQQAELIRLRIELQAAQETAQAAIAAQAEIAELRRQVDEAQSARATAEQPKPRKRGRPKKAAQAEA